MTYYISYLILTYITVMSREAVRDVTDSHGNDRIQCHIRDLLNHHGCDRVSVTDMTAIRGGKLN